MGGSVNMNLKVNEYTSRVLGVIKEKYGLRDKAQALDKFAEMYGKKYISPEERREMIKAKQGALHEARNEKDPLRLYGYKRLLEEGEDAEKLFKKAIKMLNIDCPKETCVWCENISQKAINTHIA